MKNSDGLIVLGMHRSGTSAFGGLLSEFGVYMGKNLFAPQRDVNEKGFYENSAIVKFNERLFDALYSSWNDPLLFRRRAEITALFTGYGSAACRLLHREYGNHRLWGMKDPRISILLSFWMPVFEKHGILPHYVLMLRHPAEVAASLVRRDGCSTEAALCLWIAYNLEATKCATKENFNVVTYDGLCDNPMKAIACISSLLDPRKLESLERGNFIDARLRNQGTGDPLPLKMETEEGHALYHFAVHLYDLLQYNDIDINRARLEDERFRTLNLPEVFLLQERVKQLACSEVHYRTMFEEAYTSIWWKLASPAKKIEELARRYLVMLE